MWEIIVKFYYFYQFSIRKAPNQNKPEMMQKTNAVTNPVLIYNTVELSFDCQSFKGLIKKRIKGRKMMNLSLRHGAEPKLIQKTSKMLELNFTR